MLEMLATPFMQGIGSALGSPAGPSQAYGGNQGGTSVDHSGWNITYGDQSPISAQRSQETATALDKWIPYVVIGAGFLLAWKYIKKH